MQRKVTKVPNELVAELKLQFEGEGATKVEVTPNGPDHSDVTATFPASESHSKFAKRTKAAANNG